MQNGYVENFDGRMRDELLNESLFLVSIMPAAPLRNGPTHYGSFAFPPIAPIAPFGVSESAKALIAAG
jgi:hypothetical protein